jgi:hypothetical protein
MAQPNYSLLNTNIPAEAASSAMKGMQQVNLLRTQDLENRAAQMAIDNALAEQAAYRRSGSLGEAQQNLLRGGLGKQAAALGQSIATQGKTLAETQKVGYEVDAKKMDIMRERTKDLLGNTSDENYIAHVQEGIRDGLITPEQAQRSVQTYLAIPPNQRTAFITQQLARAEKIFEANTITAAQQQSADISKRGQDISASTTRRGQDLQYAPNVVANTVTDAAGNVTQFNRFGEVIGKPGQVGKPSATFEKTQALQKQTNKDLNLAITEIENAIKPGGTLDKSTASGAGRLLDAAGNFIGYATEGAIATATLKPIADMALKMVPRFEGPQSDKDTASYKEAAGQLADSSLPVAIRRAAAQTVVRLMKARKGQFVTEGMANEGIGPSGPALPPGFTPDK